MNRSANGTPLVRLFIIPLLVFFIVIIFFIYLLSNQRSQELRGLDERGQLQAGLLAEKISSKMNTYELILEMLESHVESLEFSDQSGLEPFATRLQRYMLLNEELEGGLLLDSDGLPLYSTFLQDFAELDLTRRSLHAIHAEQGLRFSLLSYAYHGTKHMVIGQSVLDTQGNLRAIIVLVVETDQFFDQLTVSLLPGMLSSLLYDTTGTIYAIWNNPVGSESHIPVDTPSVSDIPLYNRVIGREGGATSIQGGLRIYHDGEHLLALASTSNFPMTLALDIHVPTAMTSFDRSFVFSLAAVFILLMLVLVLDHRYVRQSMEKDHFQQEMVQELSVQVQQRTAELEKLSIYDSLTGLANRRRFNEELDNAIAVHESIGITFSIAAIDLDGFKAVNDSLGHVVGDDVLVHISRILSHAVGHGGVLARWGGDELMVLYPECDRDRGSALAEGIRSAVDEQPFAADVHCTISIGLAEHLMHETATDVIRRADTALYQAKGEGKNRVVLARHESLVRPAVPQST